MGRFRIGSAFYDVVVCFCYEEGKKMNDRQKERNEWINLDREGRLSNESIWELHDSKHEELFIHMKKVCLARHRRATIIGMTLSKFKEDDKNKWYRNYLRVSRNYFNDDFEQANREARDVIDLINNSNVKDLGLLIDFYLIGIDANIKGGNPDGELLEQGNRIATNDPSILLRKLLMKIYYFEISRNCDIRISDIIDEIEGIGQKRRVRFMKNLKKTVM
jgi:hypothetical protein